MCKVIKLLEDLVSNLDELQQENADKIKEILDTLDDSDIVNDNVLNLEKDNDFIDTVTSHIHTLRILLDFTVHM